MVLRVDVLESALRARYDVDPVELRRLRTACRQPARR
jgi:hypothetical protein